jgi:DNA modification methylase
MTGLNNTDLIDYFNGFSFENSLFAIRSQDIEYITFGNNEIPLIVNELWTSKQRQGASIHEISYRACFKSQLPNFFIKLLTHKRDMVYDPFAGRGTALLEAGLLGRNIISNDINPLSEILLKPRFFVPSIQDIEQRLDDIRFDKDAKADIDLSMFYHHKTEAEIVSLRNYLINRENDRIDTWIRMVATNRLTGHSKGFLSVYTLPPNQAVTPERQIKINKTRNQAPEYRNLKEVVINKSKSLIRNLSQSDIDNLRYSGETGIFLCKDARQTKEIPDNIVQLTVTSPPFLDVVDYSTDNWLRCWFNNVNTENISKNITICKNLESWQTFTDDVFRELYRITKPGGWVAFEVGEVRNGTIKLENSVIPSGINAGFECVAVLINSQTFTKTSNIWGVNNNSKGTNTNRIILFRKGA